MDLFVVNYRAPHRSRSTFNHRIHCPCRLGMFGNNTPDRCAYILDRIGVYFTRIRKCVLYKLSSNSTSPLSTQTGKPTEREAFKKRRWRGAASDNESLFPCLLLCLETN
jgi:hypothetical protein